MTRQECAVCHYTDDDVKLGLCAWREGPGFTAEPRCQDHEACRRRVELAGERWPLKERE